MAQQVIMGVTTIVLFYLILQGKISSVLAGYFMLLGTKLTVMLLTHG